MARIIFESNKCNNIELEERNITIDDNGTYAITPNVGYAGMSKVDVNVGVDTLQGLNFAGVYDAEQADELNQYYKDGIEYAREIANSWKPVTSLYRKFLNDKRLVYMPHVDISNVTNMQYCWQTSNIEILPNLDYTNVTNLGYAFSNCFRLKSDISIYSPNLTNIAYAFTYCTAIKKISIDTSEVTAWSGAFQYCFSVESIILTSIKNITVATSVFASTSQLIDLRFSEWKAGNIALSSSSLLSAESIHYIIQNAMDIADGATARTLTLHATAKTNWQNSEYYNEDLAVLADKGITIA